MSYIKMRFSNFLAFFSMLFSAASVNNVCTDLATTPKNNCVTFTVGSGTGCDWMCNYCANQLSTNNYYFVDGVCTYQTGGCVGSPVAGKQYSCCSV